MPAVSVLVKPASGNCNMHCDYCFYCDESAKRDTVSYGMMSENTLKNVIRRTLLRAEEHYSLAFQGGEPTLRGLDFFKKAIELVRQYNRNEVRVQIALQTNGYAINEEWCRFLHDNHILTGLSVDGLSFIHDRYRHLNAGGSSYERCLEAAALMDRFGVEYNILTVVHRETALHIKEIYKDYRKRGWNYMQFITCLDPLNEERGKQEYSLTPEMFGTFMIDLFDLWYEDFRKGDAPFIRQFGNYACILAGYPPESCEQRGVCGISYTVEADGSVYPCDFYALDDMRLGNLNNDLLDVLDAKRKELRFVERSRNQPASCRMCHWFSLCRGACYRSRFTAADEAAGRGTEGLNYFCPSYKMFFEARYERLLTATKMLLSSGAGR